MNNEIIPLRALEEESSDAFDDDGLHDCATISDEIEGKRRVCSRSDDITNSLIRSVRRGASLKSLLLKVNKPTRVLLGENDRYQRNAFHYAITRPEILKELLERFKTDEDLKLVLRQEDKDGETPIHRAACFGNVKSLEILHEHDKLLLTLRSNVNKRSVLHFAVQSASIVAVQFVLSKDSDQGIMTDNMSRTPMHYAAKLNQWDIIALLISNGTDTMRKDANGHLPIHVAASNGLLNTVQLLSEDNPECIDCIDNRKQTPLILAAKDGFHSVVLYLLSEQANYLLKDNYEYSAFDWAVKNEKSGVVEVFLNKVYWKEIINGSKLGPEESLTALVEKMPETSLKLLTKCITVNGTIENPETYKVTYDFFCLQSKSDGGPAYNALNCMIENKREECLSHPLCIKYMNVKWRKRGFKYDLLGILIALLFHICLMMFIKHVRVAVRMRNETVVRNGRNVTDTIKELHGVIPIDGTMLALRVVLLLIVLGTVLKELHQMIIIQRIKYFTEIKHYVQWVLSVTVTVFLLPVDQAVVNERQIGFASIAVFLSWTSLIQFLRMLPLLGVYITAIFKVLLTLSKIVAVVLIFLLSFSSTFYVLLAECYGYKTFGVAIVSTFVAMMEGPDYQNQFVTNEPYLRRLHDLKLVVLVVFILVMTIAVNNTLIGLAVGDTNVVMKSAKISKLLHKASFIIHLEKTVNRIPGLRIPEDEVFSEFPRIKKSGYEMILDYVLYGGQNDKLESAEDELNNNEEEESESTLEDRVEKLLTTKIEKLHSELWVQLTEMHEEDVAKRNIMEEKIDKMFEKLR